MDQESEAEGSNQLALGFAGETLRRLERMRRKIGSPEEPADYATTLGAALELLEQVDDRSAEGKVVVVARDGDHLRVANIEARVLAAAKQAMKEQDDEEDWK